MLSDKNIEDVVRNGKRFQIMFMSMGEPLLNWDNVEEAIVTLNDKYPNAELLISTVAPSNSDAISKMLELSKRIPKFGLQFSIHKSTDESRDLLIPYKRKLPLQAIRDLGIMWWNETGRHPFLNYCIDGTNDSDEDAEKLMSLFSSLVFNFTFSVVCSKKKDDCGYQNLDSIKKFEEKFIKRGYNTRIFNPDGQDDIGGGCGQLWYVQDWMKDHSKTKN